MSDDLKSVLSFEHYIVESVDFKVNLKFEKKSKVDVTFDLKRNVEYDEKSRVGVVSVTTTLFDEFQEKNYPFYMQIKVIGYFKIETSKHDPVDLLRVNAVAILFPYIRALVSTYTAGANIQPLILPAINVNNLQ
jgi:preprotein translocase subunit SecB